YFGHEAAVSHVHWGTETMSDHFLTSSLDGTAQLWNVSTSDPVLSFGIAKKQATSIAKSPSIRSTNSTPATNTSISASNVFQQPQFFFKDKFILTSFNKRNLQLHSYKIQQVKGNEIKPGLNYNTSKVVKSIEFPSAIACFDAPNAFSSYTAVVVTGGGNSALGNIVDLWQGKVVSTFAAKAVHTVSVPNQNSGCSRDLFLTASLQDSIKMWDLRVATKGGEGCSCGSVMQFLGHVNRYGKAQCALSPCGRYALTGSEDKQAYMYDVRGGGVIVKYREGITDTVLGVDFHPSKRIIGTASSDGRVNMFHVDK
ncbi:UNVERIFIED_CONTAM: Signal-induced proliferation-associated 1-like protein 2, partial [Siphonaria sp. JEL0065]